MKKLLFLTTTLFVSIFTSAQTPTLVKDITPSNPSTNFGANGSNPSGVIINNTLFAIFNFGLWKSDGTENGTTILKSFSYQNEIIGIGKAGNVAFFTEYLSTNNIKLWKSDGTINGTVAIANVAGTIIQSIEMNGVFYFVCSNSSYFSEIWRSDGTAAGTYLIKNTNQYGLNFNTLEVIGNTLYFVANEPSTTGIELWKTDGTVANTQLVKDIYIGSESANPQNLLAVNGILYFSAQNAYYEQELWRSDGTSAGTYLVKNINPYYGSNPNSFQTVNNKLIFSADNGSVGREIWVSDGTSGNTFLLKDILSGYQSSYYQNYAVQNSSINGVALFIANDGINGFSLWKTDGTATGTDFVKDLVPGYNDDPSIFNIFIYKTLSKVYFSVSNNDNFDDLWQSDGTVAGTSIVNSLNPNLEFYLKNSSLMTNNKTGNNFFFPAYDKVAGIELWKTDGTTTGLLRVKDITTGGGQSSDIKQIGSINGYTFFSANNIINGTELWRTDGTATNTQLFKDFTKGFDNSGNTSFGFMTLFKNQLYIQTNIGKIWRTDGTQLSLFKSFPAGGALPNYPSLVIGDNMFFVNAENINNNNIGFELFKTDGTNTTLVKDINTGNFSDSFPEKFCNVNGTLFFTANDGINGRELWKSDGTESGTVMVKNISSGANFTNFNQLIASNGLLFFMTDNYTKLWRSDGTNSGTFQLYDAGSSYMGPMIGFNNKIFFTGFESAFDGELWESDGTTAGTKITKNINPTYGSYPSNFVEMNGAIYFNANSQFWKSDGTTAGTVMISSIVTPYNLFNANGILYFSSYSNGNGIELWQSDGTPSGTKLLADINTGPNSSYPNSFFLDNTGKLYFLAEKIENGVELFVIFPCPQNLTLTATDNYPTGTTIKQETNISIIATNKISSGANIKYDAGKYVLLNAGFEANAGSVFKAYIDGCNNDEPNLTTSNKPVYNISNVEDLTKNYPTIHEFFRLPENAALRTAYSIAISEKETFEKNKMILQNTSTSKGIAEPVPISYYITETGQKEGIVNYRLALKIGEKEYISTLQKKL